MGRKSLSGKTEYSESQEELEFWTIQCLKEQCELWNLSVSGSKEDIILQMVQHLQQSGKSFSRNQYSKWTFDSLRKVLKERSLSYSGSKTDLIGRLEGKATSEPTVVEESTPDDNKENTHPISPQPQKSASPVTSPQDNTPTTSEDNSQCSPRNIRDFLLQKKKKKQRARRRSVVYGQKRSPARHQQPTHEDSPQQSPNQVVPNDPSPSSPTPSSPLSPLPTLPTGFPVFPSPSILRPRRSRTPSPRNTSPCTSPQDNNNNSRTSPAPSHKPASPQQSPQQKSTPSPKSSPKQETRRSPRHSIGSYNSPPPSYGTPRKEGATPRKSILKSPMTPRTKANIQWKAVEVREYERCHGGSLGIPDKGAFPLGLDWEVSNIHRKSVNDYEKWRQQQRVSFGCNLSRIPEQQRKKILMQWESEENLQDPDQKKDCTEIRQSRKNIGCMCNVGKSGASCDSRKCICVKNGIECHEDTCACTNDTCRNPSRHSFDETRVEQFVQTRIQSLNAKGKYFLESDEEEIISVVVTNK